MYIYIYIYKEGKEHALLSTKKVIMKQYLLFIFKIDEVCLESKFLFLF